MPFNAEFTFIIPRQNESHIGFCKDLSHTGINFVTGWALSEGQSIEVTLSTNNDTFEPMKASVEIIRVVSTENNKYDIAGKILKFF
jgi:hypothetical protein